MSNKNEQQKSLKDDFISKINSEWQTKWAVRHGGLMFNFSNLKSQNAFLEDLLDDIEAVIKKKVGLDETSKILISTDNLRRIFNDQHSVTFQEKTRNTLAYYIGYDGWADYSKKNAFEPNELSSDTENEIVKPQENRRILLSVLIFVCFLICMIVVFWESGGNKSNDFQFDIQLLTKSYPSSLLLNYDITKLNAKNAQVLIDNEVLEYTKQPLLIKLNTHKDKIPIYFFTPGVKKISLAINNARVAEKFVTVSTGDEWYGCARIKSVTIPKAFEDNTNKKWYGNFNELFENTSTNWITPPTTWTSYLHQDKGVLSYPENELHFPDNEIKSDQKTFSRVALLKTGDFNLGIDTVTLRFKAKRDKYLGEDCMSFMVRMVDENANFLEFYSSSNCKAVNCIIARNNDKIFNYHDEKFNGILEDLKWHTFELKILNKIIYVSADGVALFSQPYQASFKELNELWFIFEGNGHVDDVVIENSNTKKIILQDDFSRK